ncbi:MAG: citrate/2-methylcitrate synthase [Pseudomonadota bacterium]
MTFKPGLEGVVAAQTAISNVDGDLGQLTYRGYAIEDLVEQRYLSVLWLIMFGDLPDESEYADLDAFLSSHGALSARDVAMIELVMQDRHPMQSLQALVPALHLPPQFIFQGLDETGSRGLQVIAKMPALIATLRQLELGAAPPKFDSYRGYLDNFLAMFTGTEPSREAVRILKIVQILQMEHSLNSGTFASLVVGSTLAPVEAVFSAGIGALSGALHGGADEAAVRAAYEVGSPEKAEAWVASLLAGGGKFMGMGHREYRVMDPRAIILKPIAEQICPGSPAENTLRTLEAMGAAFASRMGDKPIKPNMEFYKGAILEALGIPMHYFTALFAMSRMVGWLAHLMEFRPNNRLLRPRAEYIGLPPRKLE